MLEYQNGAYLCNGTKRIEAPLSLDTLEEAILPGNPGQNNQTAHFGEDSQAEYAGPDAGQTDYRTRTGTVERPSLKRSFLTADSSGQRGTGPEILLCIHPCLQFLNLCKPTLLFPFLPSALVHQKLKATRIIQAKIIKLPHQVACELSLRSAGSQTSGGRASGTPAIPSAP